MLTLPATSRLADLVGLTRDIAARPHLWEPAVRFDARARHWTRLPAPDDVDVWLQTWWPDQHTELHDHGDAAAALTVVRGVLHDVQPDPQGHLRADEIAAGGTRWVAPRVVHDVVNRGPAPAVSIHAYAPRLVEMNYWRASPSGLRAVRTVTTDQPEQGVVR